MTDLYPEIEPYEHGMLDVGDGNRVHWEVCGNGRGKPAVVLHGGPGSGCSPRFRRLFDPVAYRLVLFDQRGCGRSTPHASAPDADLASNNTGNLIADIERLREHLEIDRWLVLGGSWGSTLALAVRRIPPGPGHGDGPVRRHDRTPQRVRLDVPRRPGRLLPRAVGAPPRRPAGSRRDGDIVEAYHRLLHDPDPAVRQRAAEAWCTWESATPAWPPDDWTGREIQRSRPMRWRSRASSRTTSGTTPGWRTGSLLRDDGSLAGIPGVLVNGRFDFQAPIGNAWELKRVWPRAELVIVDDAGHAASPASPRELVRATDRFRG